MKTQMSRFHIHDDLSAPEGSLPVLKGAMAAGGQLPNFLGVLAGSPAALRAYARFRVRAAPRQPAAADARADRARRRRALPQPARHRHPHAHGAPGRASASTRSPRARDWESADPREAALLRYLRALVEQRGNPPMHLHEEAREAGWSDEQLLEAIAYVVARVADRHGQRRRRGARRRLVRGHSRPEGGVGFAPWNPCTAPGRRVAVATLEPPAASCCPHLHEAVELIGKRWSGAIIVVLLEGGPMRFSEIAQAIPQLSDRLLSERMKELEARGIVERRVAARRAEGRVRAHGHGPRARAGAPAAEVLVSPLAGLTAVGVVRAVQCRPPARCSRLRRTWISRTRRTTSRRSPRSTGSGSSACGSPTSSAS